MKHLLKSREIWLFLALVAVVICTTFRSPAFGSLNNLLGIFNNSSMLIILALGQMVVIITRSIDLSMAANLALSGMCVALINAAYPEISVPVLVCIAMACGTILGAFNGLLIWKRILLNAVSKP